MRFGSTYITEPYRIIQAIGKHVITQNTLSGAGVGIRIDESAQFGIVIARLEIVERGLSVLGLSAMPIHTLYTHTKPNGFHVGNLVTERIICLMIKEPATVVSDFARESQGILLVDWKENKLCKLPTPNDFLLYYND